jgi:hypothetical protein
VDGALARHAVGDPVVERARRVLVVTQSVFFGALGLCVVVRHGPVVRVDGISYYGVYGPTMPLLFTGFITGAVGLWRLGNLVAEAGAPAAWRVALHLVAVALLALLATPYSAGTFFNWAHMSVGVAGALVQLVLALAIAHRAATPGARRAFALLLAGGMVAALSLPAWTFPFLLHGEIVFEVGFAWSLIEMVRTLGRPSRTPLGAVQA